MTTNIVFFEDRKQVEFTVTHNLDKFGLSIQAVLDNWLARTDTYTAESFCDYVKSKDPINIICKTP